MRTPSEMAKGTGRESIVSIDEKVLILPDAASPLWGMLMEQSYCSRTFKSRTLTAQ